jgi:Flp pilus assembly CpaF family ATPase
MDGTYERQLAKLRKDLGEVFLAALADPDTVEIMLNANGALWCERLGEQIRPIGTMTGNSAEAAMRTIAAYHHATITRDNHSIECELPLDGSRFSGQIPPIVSTPVFAVRKGASRVFTLQQYVEAVVPKVASSMMEAMFNTKILNRFRSLAAKPSTESLWNIRRERFLLGNDTVGAMVEAQTLCF